MNDDYDVAAREAYITGRPPRIAPLAPHELPPVALEAMNRIRASIALGPIDVLPEFHAITFKVPGLARAYLEFAQQIFDCVLPVRDKELMVLRVAWLCKAPFEWGEHVKVGRHVAAITEEEIERIKLGSAAPDWSEHERALMKAVEELIGDAMITDETWEVLARTLTEAQLIEIPMVVCLYQGTAYWQNALRSRLPEGNEGLAAR
jgi:4-carboxymuconolactone decarboxylase